MALDTKRPVASLVKGGLFISFLSIKCSAFPGMVSHMQILATYFSTVHNTIDLDLTSETILVLAACT